MAIHSSVEGSLAEARRDRSWADPALLFGCIFAALMVMGPRLLNDPDCHWHVVVGADLWRSRSFPWTDPYSHTFAGAPWIAKEWLSQLIMFAATAVGGWSGLVIVTALTIAGVLTALFAWLARRMRAMTALTLTLLALIFLTPHLLARPHIFALVPLMIWTMGLVDALDERRSPPLWLVGIMALWANLHGSFTFGYLLAGILGCEAILLAPAGRRLATMLRWAVFGLLSLAAGCLTPYGIHAILVTVTVFGGSGEHLPYIAEWEPIGWTFHGFMAVGTACLLAAALAAGGWRNAARIAALAGVTLMLVRHSRFVDVFGIVGPILVAVPLVRRFPALAPEPPARAGGWRRHSLAALAAVAAAGLALAILRAPAPSPSVTPKEALAAARQAGLVDGKVYNNHDYGGFLIAERIPTFIDGRTDQLFLGGFLKTLFEAILKAEGSPFIGIVERHGATWALVPSGAKESRHFDAAPGWRRIHRDETASVYARG